MKQLRFSIFLAVFMIAPALLFSQVKTFEEVVGHKIGDRITKTHQIVDYLNYLHEASDRVSAFEIGTTYNHKLQMGAVLTHPDNHARIDEIKDNAQKLNDPRTISSSEAEEIIETQPAILYLAGSIHGFELSGTEGVLWLLDYFTTNDDDEVMEQLRNTVMVLDPNINSDGRDAFAQYNHQHLGRTVTSDMADWANDFNFWEAVKYRTSHYYFDLNRDWFAHTHYETRNRAAVLQEWRPQAGVDAHEMGHEREFYVDPPTDPVSPIFPAYATKWFELYGKAHADIFDEYHVEYTKGEIFNFFYPAYFTSYMTYQGAVGMLYEQGSTRGFAIERSDGTVRTYPEAAKQQYLAFRAMVGLSSDRRQELVSDYYQANVDAIEAGRSGTVRYMIKEEGDPARVADVVNLLMRSGVEVHQLTEDASIRNVTDREGSSVGSHSFPAGTYVIESSQPRHLFIRNMLDPEVPMPEGFLEEARERVDRGENPRFYDITAWSLPLFYNLQGFSSSDSRSVNTERVTEPVKTGSDVPVQRAQYAYLIDGNQSKALSAIPYLRKNEIRMNVLLKPTQVNRVPFASGTLVVRVDGNYDKVHNAVSKMADRYGLVVEALDSGQADDGFPPVGSVESLRVNEPNIVLLGDFPVSAYSFGWAWHTLDRVYEIPHIVMKTRSLGSTQLERFNVIVLPELFAGAQLAQMMGEDGIARLQRWVRDGGTLVAIGSASDFVKDHLELSGLESWYDDEENRHANRVSVPGAFFRTEVDSENWLTSGYSYDAPVLINSNRLLREPEGAPSPARNAAITIAEGDSHIAGHAWEENLERVPGSVFLYEERVGSGRVITFAEDPNFRGYWRGANRLFLNAVVLGASAP